MTNEIYRLTLSHYLGDEAKLDTGKVMALHQEGWSVKDIAGEMGCSQQFIEKALQEKDQNNESEML